MIKTPTQLSNRPKEWTGDRCIRRLLYVNPESIRLLDRPGPLHVHSLYLGLEEGDIRKCQVGTCFTILKAQLEDAKKMVKTLRALAAGEAKCNDCGKRHNSGADERIPRAVDLYLASPGTEAVRGV